MVDSFNARSLKMISYLYNYIAYTSIFLLTGYIVGMLCYWLVCSEKNFITGIPNATLLLMTLIFLLVAMLVIWVLIPSFRPVIAFMLVSNVLILIVCLGYLRGVRHK